jgi:hypothetical protein
MWHLSLFLKITAKDLCLVLVAFQERIDAVAAAL